MHKQQYQLHITGDIQLHKNIPLQETNQRYNLKVIEGHAKVLPISFMKKLAV